MQPIEHNLQVKASPSESFRAAATPEGIKAWWTRNSGVGTRPGDPVELHFERMGTHSVMNFEIAALEPDSRVEWVCTGNVNPVWPGSRLTWEVTAAPGGGSTIRFRHEGFSGGGDPYDNTVVGWQFFMDSLQQYLDTGTGQPSD